MRWRTCCYRRARDEAAHGSAIDGGKKQCGGLHHHHHRRRPAPSAPPPAPRAVVGAPPAGGFWRPLLCRKLPAERQQTAGALGRGGRRGREPGSWSGPSSVTQLDLHFSILLPARTDTSVQHVSHKTDAVSAQLREGWWRSRERTGLEELNNVLARQGAGNP